MPELRCLARFKVESDALDFGRFAAQCAEWARARGVTAPRTELSFVADASEIQIFAWQGEAEGAALDDRAVSEAVQALLARCR